MKIGSLFAGIGGFDLGLERAGHQVVWHSEIDRHASKVLAHHWPDIPNYGDIHDISPSLDSIPTVDVLVGGFPCQDYSVAGNRDGLAGDRGALWWEYRRLIAGLHPTWVIGENVPGLLSSRGGRDFETIIGSLTELGYGVAWAVLDSQYFGVAQRRRRVFFVGHSGGYPRPQVLALSEGLFGHPQPGTEAWEEPASSLTSRIGTSGPDVADAQALWLTVGALRARDYKDAATDTASPPLIVNSAQDPISGPLAQPLDQNARGSQVVFAQNQRDELRDLGDIAGALAAEPGMKQQSFIANGYTGVRRITPLECERLQGFPDHWTRVPGNSTTQRYRQLGNAVTVNVAEWIGRNLQ